MPRTNQHWYRTLCQGLLVYLVVLNLIGFSWHLHSHYESSVVVVVDEDAQLSSDEACVVCDWLVHHTYHISDQLQTEEGVSFNDLVTYSFRQNIDYPWYYQYRPARAPPARG